MRLMGSKRVPTGCTRKKMRRRRVGQGVDWTGFGMPSGPGTPKTLNAQPSP